MFEIEELLEIYAKNIADFIDLCEGKLVVFDFDGTLTKLQYTENRILPCFDEKLQQYTLEGGNVYQNAKMLKTMQYVFSKLNLEDVRVLTTSVPALRDIKSNLINKHFLLPLNQIIHSDNDLHKLFFLKQIYEQEKREIIFVEDTVKTLLNAEETLDFVRGYHISNFLA